MEEYRRLLTTYAYNILGSLEDAYDVVQDVFLKFSAMDQQPIENKKAYLVRMTINSSINFKNKWGKDVSNYPGEWLPEPIATEAADAQIDSRETLGYSLLVLLEKLSPKHRAVFILREAFDYSHDEIADVLGISTDNSRAILLRAKDALKKDKISGNFIPPREYLDTFIEVIRKGDTERLEHLLNEDILMVSDGGGKATAATKPLFGREKVVAFISGITRKFYQGAVVRRTVVNHQPAFLYFDPNGTLHACQILTIENDLITEIFMVRNPDKLQQIQNSLPYLSHSEQ